MDRSKYSQGVVTFLGFIVLILSATSAGQAFAADAGIRVVSPPDQIWVIEGDLFLAGVVSNGQKNVAISGVDADAKKGQINVTDGGVFGVGITLKEGLNTIRLESGSDKSLVNVFYTKDRKKKAPPQDYKRFYVHTKPAALLCNECHRLRKGQFDFKKLVPARSNCTTKCHEDKGKAKHVHGPVGAGVCISCHSPHGSFEPSFMERSGQELCTICHQARKEEFSQKVLHAPVEEGCTECHNPHESDMRYQLNGTGDRVSTLCYNCHEKGMFSKDHQHAPVEEGDCIACHRPHSSPNNFLLIAPPAGGELCFLCHEDRKVEFQMEYLHAPVQEDCSQCHDPHSSPNKYQLIKKGDDGTLCAMCHADATPEIYATINNATVKHPPVAEGRCVDCHRVHSSSYPSMLKDSLETMCLSCHTDLGDYISESKNRHGPVQTGSCTECHNPHGSTYSRLLVRDYPTEFYSEYGPQKYDLCFGCHNKDIAKTKTTETLTNFRDGSYNLHFFHVNSEKGRTCTACHDPHASNQDKHIRYEVPFGAWSYPINITRTDTGGTCVVGCHAPKTYDRKVPKIKAH
ncbi:MAG: cytochrome C [Proteobacteria bacterium]|nr:cytochrome C [Pseudomonadota bacterium]MBU1688472.1 cytochrome C [Pseudomonadota bacterium]